MSELRKANTDNTYFITFTIVGWIDLFTRSIYSDIMIDSLIYCQKNKSLDIFAYVIMPSHLHFIARSLDNNMSDIIRDMKSFTAKEIIKTIQKEQGESRKEWLIYLFSYYAKYQKQNEKYQFWQKTSHPIEILDEKMFIQKRDYIHNNPVAAGLVNDPESWIYSSANLLSRLKMYEY